MSIENIIMLNIYLYEYEETVDGPTDDSGCVPLMLRPLYNYHYNGFCRFLHIKGIPCLKSKDKRSTQLIREDKGS